jgi:single-stranded-DNA-specific exonuclease
MDRCVPGDDAVKNGQGPGEDLAGALIEGLGLHPLIARILVSRGIRTTKDAEAFLFPKLADLSDPFLLPDIERGLERIIAALTTGERIAVFGDYDADGITSAALIVNFFGRVGQRPLVYIPKREEGYGLSTKAVDEIGRAGATLLVCVDCGSTNVEEVAYARRMGIDTVIIDHHELGGPHPDCAALINPKERGSRFPTRELAACGVTFFVLLGLRRMLVARGFMRDAMNLKQELDIVALGTIGDMVPLTGDNRILVRFGLDMMKRKPRPWLKSFARQNMLPRGGITEQALNFVIIPRINATGRVANPARSLDFLICENLLDAEACLLDLHEANRERQRIEEEILREGMAMVKEEGLLGRNSIILFKSDWHTGVVGIVAQRLSELYGKPSVIFTRVNGLLKGSGRGGEGLNLYQTVQSLSHLTVRFGGHRFACGISLAEENLGPFREAFEGAVERALLTETRPRPVDADTGFTELSSELMEGIDMLSPFGMGNPRPNLLFPPAVISSKNRLLKITDGEGRTWFGFSQGKKVIPFGLPVRIVASPVIREDMGERFIYLQIVEALAVP